MDLAEQLSLHARSGEAPPDAAADPGEQSRSRSACSSRRAGSGIGGGAPQCGWEQEASKKPQRNVRLELRLT